MAAQSPQTIQEIAQAWEQAKAQFAALREQVEKAGELANLKLQSAILERDEDKALRDFGAAVWKEVTRGGLKLPASLNSAVKAMQEMQKRKDAQSKELADVLKEGDEAADRLKKASKSKPAGKTGKR